MAHVTRFLAIGVRGRGPCLLYVGRRSRRFLTKTAEALMNKAQAAIIFEPRDITGKCYLAPPLNCLPYDRNIFPHAPDPIFSPTDVLEFGRTGRLQQHPTQPIGTLT